MSTPLKIQKTIPQNKRGVLCEITPLMTKDVLYIAERHKKEFTYPIHNHSTFELNFVENGAGAERIIGDSHETIGDYDLVLIANGELEHVWKQHKCKSEDIHEITIHFDFNFNEDSFFGRNPFSSVRKMMEEARKGLCFSVSDIMRVYSKLEQLTTIDDHFYAVMQFLSILYELSKSKEARALATTSYANVAEADNSRRILRVKEFISQHYKEDIRLCQIADIAGMAPSSFSRFFKNHTNRTLSEYIIEIRLGYAARLLVDTTMSVAEISFNCGFNNLSNFNRTFKTRKGISPSQFRENYRKKRIVV